MAWSPSHAIGKRIVSPCGPEYFESEDREDPPPLKDFIEILAELKIYSTSDFFTKDLPDEITKKPLRDYPELNGEWNNLWNKVHDRRRARGEKIEDRRKPSFEELQAFIMKMVSEDDDIEHIPGEEFPEEEEKPLTYDYDYQETPQQITEPVRYNSKEEVKESILALITENEKISIPEMATQTNRSKTYIKLMIFQLKEEGRLIRVGYSNNGHWKIPQEGETPDHYDSPEEIKERLLALITENDKITIPEMVKQTGRARRTINRMISQLKEEGRLIRIGFQNNGYWRIPQEGETPDHYDSPEEIIKKRLLALIAENEKITILEMVKQTGQSRGIINRMISQLKEEGRLIRIGFSSNKYWKIPQEGETPDHYDSPEKVKESILALIAENEKITTPEMAKQTDREERTINRLIFQLKKEGRLIRIGSNRFGRWVVLQEGVPVYHDLYEEREEIIRAFMVEIPEISIPELAEKMGRSERIIRRSISIINQRNGWLGRDPIIINKEGRLQDHYDSPEEIIKKSILALIAENEKISIPEMATQTNRYESTIKLMIFQLKKEGRLIRVGFSKTGHWKIPQKGETPDHLITNKKDLPDEITKKP